VESRPAGLTSQPCRDEGWMDSKSHLGCPGTRPLKGEGVVDVDMRGDGERMDGQWVVESTA